jgi:hypothetical protein
LDDVYSDRDPRNYQLSSYSYFILPTKVRGQFTAEKGKTLGAFSYYSMCQGQQQSASLGYSPMPINLVEASFEQIRKIPGVVAQDIDIKTCKNPTFSEDGTNTLAKNAPQPPECDKQGPSQCTTGTGGAKKVSTPVATAAGGGAAGGGAAGGAAAGGGSSGAAAPGSKSGTTPTARKPTQRTGAAGAGSAATGAVDGASDVGASPDLGAEGGTLAGALDGTVDPLASPIVLTSDAGWGSSQTLIFIVAALALALVLGPPFVWRRLAAGASVDDATSRSRSAR